MHHTALREDARRRIDQIGGTDILVGIPSFNNAGTIGYVAEMAATGMTEHFPDLKPVLVNSDGGSTDGTREMVRGAAAPTGVEVIATEYDGPSGKGSAFRAIFEIAEALGCRVCVVVDSDLRSINPRWIELLAGPIVRDGFGYVTPYYVRHKYDGTITNNLAYPLTRALYGVGVRQPIGGDFGFSGPLARSFLEQEVWQTDVARFGIDVFMTTTAINEGHRVCQANLGAKVHDPKDPAASLGPMFMQVVGTLFRMMGLYEARWRWTRGSRPAPRIGPPLEQEAEPVAISLEALIAKFRAGAERLGPLWERVLEPETRRAVQALAATPASVYSFPAEIWAHAVYDFAVAYNRSGRPAPELIDALVPLYYGRTGGLVLDTRAMDPDAFEAYVDAQAQAFEELKGYLLARWDAAGG
jgi:hypothetical protein